MSYIMVFFCVQLDKLSEVIIRFVGGIDDTQFKLSFNKCLILILDCVNVTPVN